MTYEEWQRKFDEMFPDGAVVSWMAPGDDYGDDNVHVMHVSRIIVKGPGESGPYGTPGSVWLSLFGPGAGKIAEPVFQTMEPYTDDPRAPADAVVLRGSQEFFWVVSGELTPEMKQRLKQFREDPEEADYFVSPVIPEEQREGVRSLSSR